MQYLLEYLQLNAKEDLWDHCDSIFSKFNAVQQGEPLMLYLLLNEIQDISETAIGHLLTEFEKLKISDIEGENVNIMIGRIRSINKTLESVSSKP